MTCLLVVSDRAFSGEPVPPPRTEFAEVERCPHCVGASSPVVTSGGGRVFTSPGTGVSPAPCPEAHHVP